MFKLVGLGAIMATMFACCCSMGTFLPDMLGANGPTSFQDLLQQADSSGEEQGASGPFFQATPEEGADSAGLSLFGHTLPEITNPLGETEIEIGQVGEITDIPQYPGAEAATGNVSIPGAVGLLMSRWKDDLEKEGVSYALYSTADTSRQVSEWYQSEMPGQGWKNEMAVDVQQGALLAFSNEQKEVSSLFYVFGDGDSGETMIFVLRSRENK